MVKVNSDDSDKLKGLFILWNHLIEYLFFHTHQRLQTPDCSHHRSGVSDRPGPREHEQERVDGEQKWQADECQYKEQHAGVQRWDFTEYGRQQTDHRRVACWRGLQTQMFIICSLLIVQRCF